MTDIKPVPPEGAYPQVPTTASHSILAFRGSQEISFDNDDDCGDQDDEPYYFANDVDGRKKRIPSKTFIVAQLSNSFSNRPFLATATASSLSNLQRLELVRRDEENDRISTLPVDQQTGAQNYENQRCAEWDRTFAGLQATSQAQSLQLPSATTISRLPSTHSSKVVEINQTGTKLRKETDNGHDLAALLDERPVDVQPQRPSINNVDSSINGEIIADTELIFDPFGQLQSHDAQPGDMQQDQRRTRVDSDGAPIQRADKAPELSPVNGSQRRLTDDSVTINLAALDLRPSSKLDSLGIAPVG